MESLLPGQLKKAPPGGGAGSTHSVSESRGEGDLWGLTRGHGPAEPRAGLPHHLSASP